MYGRIVDVLRLVHLTGGVFLHAEFFAPCAWRHASRPSIVVSGQRPLDTLYYVVEGEFRMQVEGQKR